MLNILIIGVGRLKESWEREACAEYIKRLKRYCQLEIRELDDQPEPDKPSDILNQRVMEREGKDILACIRPTDRVVALCIDGKSYDSLQFADKMAAWSMEGRRLVLVIGGSPAHARDPAGAGLPRVQDRRERAIPQIAP